MIFVRLRSFVRRFTQVFRRGSSESSLSAELAAHLEALTDRHRAAGLSPAHARTAALREFGGVEQIKERCRDARSLLWLDHFLRDFRSALLALVRSPGFTATSIITVAVGIGLSTAQFSLMNAILLRTFPYPDGGKLVRVFGVSRTSDRLGLPPANFLDVKSSAQSFSAISAFSVGDASFAEPGQPTDLVSGISASADFLDTLQVRPALGRAFRSDEDQPGRPNVILLTDHFWRHRYGADPGVLGRTVRLDRQPYTIIGVLPASFESIGWGAVEYIRPLTIWPTCATDRKNAWFRCIARLAPAHSLHAAQSELTVIGNQLAAAYPQDNDGIGFRVTKAYGADVDPAALSLHLLLTGLATLVLVVACVNLSGLQFARALVREREFAVRVALGASRVRLLCPLIVESLLVAFAGSGLGLLVGHVAATIIARHFQSIEASANHQVFLVPIDWHVAGFGVAAAVIAAVAFGLAPAWLAACRSTSAALKLTAQTVTTSRQQHRIRGLLVLGQLALATVVMSTAAGVAVASHRLLARDTGWNIDGLYTCWLGLSGDRYSGKQAVLDFQRDLLERIRSLPGVEVASLGSALPNVYFGDPADAEIEGRPVASRDRQPTVSSIMVTADYFSTLQIPFLKGAGFPLQFSSDSPLVAIVNETMAQTFWPNENPIGKRLRFHGTELWLQVIGVVRDVRVFGSPVAPTSSFDVYRPLAQSPSNYFACILRTSGAPTSLASEVCGAVRAIDPDLPVRRAGSLRQIATESNSFPLLNKCLALMAVISTGLAMLGVYAMLSQLAAQRTREFGVRIALGARPADIFNLVLRQGTILLAIGGIFGVGCSLAVGRLLHSVMAELEFPGFVFSAGILTALSLLMWLAASVPARRAAKMDPVGALRAE